MTVRAGHVRLDREGVAIQLEALGSRDPDVLHECRARLMARAKRPKRMGLVVAFGGGALSMSLGGAAWPLGAAGGAPLVAWGCWLIRRGVREARAVEDGWRDFVAGAR
jgi:hypothetical protein